MSDMEQNTEQTQAQTAEVEAPATTEASTEEKTFTQADLDKIVADRVSRERRKFEKKYEGIDPEYYTELSAKAEKEKQDKLKAKGEFEQILKDTVSKKDEQIGALLNQVKTIKIDGALLDAASKMKAVNPGQVVKLIKDQVKMNEAGDVEIVDPKTGQTRYKDDGNHFTIQNLTNEFLTANPHFVSATPSGAGTTSNIGDKAGSGEQFDVSKLDMSKADDRAKYAEYRKKNGLA